MPKLLPILLLFFIFIGACTPDGNETQVFVVRHAEKAISESDDPPLSEKGKLRAARLWEQLKADSVNALFSTEYQRTRATLEPIADQHNLPINLYEAHDYAGLVAKIKGQHAGETLIVSGHSNTVLPIIQALGASPPIDSIGEQDYDYIFEVQIHSNGTAEATVSHFRLEPQD